MHKVLAQVLLSGAALLSLSLDVPRAAAQPYDHIYDDSYFALLFSKSEPAERWVSARAELHRLCVDERDLGAAREQFAMMEGRAADIRADALNKVGADAPAARRISGLVLIDLKRTRTYLEWCEQQLQPDTQTAFTPEPAPLRSPEAGGYLDPAAAQNRVPKMDTQDLDDVIERLEQIYRSGDCKTFAEALDWAADRPWTRAESERLGRLYELPCPPPGTARTASAPQPEPESILDELEPTKDLFGQDWVGEPQASPAEPTVDAAAERAAALDRAEALFLQGDCKGMRAELDRIEGLSLTSGESARHDELADLFCPSRSQAEGSAPPATAPAVVEDSILDELEPTKDLFGQDWVEPSPPPAVSREIPLDPTSARMLEIHNLARAEVGVAPLIWDPALALAAQAYAGELSRIGRLVHSPRKGRENQRENLAAGPRGSGDPAQFVQMFADEKRYFVPGYFPNVSSTGNWADVSHYTQMIWEGTTHVGCGFDASTAMQYVVCRYTPPGNADGRPVFSHNFGTPPPPPPP